ncbi:hypothetical protein IEQ34_005369 [Dendrobium chrysotoxum]|uniref:Uncharacterized protein n=1 Tax=Dendrobium chrysotoxum TaxID=161865 RepID=A0AAV7H8P3_DENCH|nr:hypothetical protein IEQ34_005369 [Dendrobium chrysotoxum]
MEPSGAYCGLIKVKRDGSDISAFVIGLKRRGCRSVLSRVTSHPFLEPKQRRPYMWLPMEEKRRWKLTAASSLSMTCLESKKVTEKSPLIKEKFSNRVQTRSVIRKFID